MPIRANGLADGLHPLAVLATDRFRIRQNLLQRILDLDHGVFNVVQLEPEIVKSYLQRPIVMRKAAGHAPHALSRDNASDWRHDCTTNGRPKSL
jgi:hypothetical protein